MNKREFLEEYAEWFPEKRSLCDKHTNDFPEILSHVFAGDAVNDEMIRAFQNGDTEEFGRFCSFINHVWRLVYQDDSDEILNVIWVTILERISDDSAIWQRFGGLIGDEFKEYINEVVLAENAMMTHVEKLR